MKNPNINRRAVLLSAAVALPVIALVSTSAQAAQVSPKSVNYQATPKNGLRCDGCKLFVAPGSCTVVSGPIAPSGWCSLWQKKA